MPSIFAAASGTRPERVFFFFFFFLFLLPLLAR